MMNRPKVHVIVFILSMLFACASDIGSDSDPADEDMTTAEYIIPVQTIAVDGDASDWAGLDPVSEDPPGDENPEADFEGTDLNAFYLAQDQDFIYFLMTFHDGDPLEDGTGYCFTANQIAGELDTSGDFVSTIFFSGGQWTVLTGIQDGQGQLSEIHQWSADPHVAVGRNLIEWRVPKDIISGGDIDEKYAGVFIRYPGENHLFNDENITNIKLYLNDSSADEGSAPSINITQGNWEGETEEGYPVHFIVSENSVTEFAITFDLSTGTNVIPAPIDENNTFVSEGLFIAGGTFENENYCRGTWGTSDSRWDAQPALDPPSDSDPPLDSDPSSEEPASEIYCNATCDRVGWGVTGGVGPTTNQASCSRRYVGSSYIENCTGTLTYEGSGDVYPYSSEINWPNCSISVVVEGVGTCFDSALQ